MNSHFSFLLLIIVLIFVLVLGSILVYKRIRAQSQKEISPGVPDETNLKLIDSNGIVIPIRSLPAYIHITVEKNIVLNDHTDSAHYAAIYYDETLKAICIEDNGLQIGFRVNGGPTRKNILANGDTILIGEITLIFQSMGFSPYVVS